MTLNDAPSTAGLTSPLQWPWAVASPPLMSSERTPWRGALLRRWSGTSSRMVQPPLDHHYVVMHLGGAKHVTRRRDGPAVSSIAENGSITLVPAGTAYEWKTVGPIGFAHLYLSPRQLERQIGAQFEIQASGVSVVERVGCRDQQLEPLFARMVDELAESLEPSRLLLDSLLESLVIRLALRHSSAPPGSGAATVALAPHRLRRVLDFIDANLGEDIGLEDLVAAAGTSQFHFSRAFRVATGSAPYRYLLMRRIDYARVLLLAGREPLTEVGARCGFNSRHQFSLMFKRVTGITPKRFRLGHGDAARSG